MNQWHCIAKLCWCAVKNLRAHSVKVWAMWFDNVTDRHLYCTHASHVYSSWLLKVNQRSEGLRWWHLFMCPCSQANHPPSVLWLHCWLGHQTCKNRRPYNLYCVGADVKPCSINQSINQSIGDGDIFSCVPAVSRIHDILPLVDMHHLTCGISSFIPSTSFCSLSSWFTSSCTYHLITVTTFALTIYHPLYLSLQT